MWFFEALTLILVVAKLLGITAMGWFMCFLPVIIPFLVAFFFFVVALIAAMIKD